MGAAGTRGGGGGEEQSVVFGILIVPTITLYTKQVALHVPLLENIQSIFNIHTKIQCEKLSKLTATTCNKQSLD